MANAQPFPNIPVKSALMTPAPGQVIVSYQIIDPETGCCKCNDLTGCGVLLLVIGLLFFWPIALIPCFMSDCKNKSQMPVYGYPPGVAMQAPVVYGAPMMYAPGVVHVAAPTAIQVAPPPPQYQQPKV